MMVDLDGTLFDTSEVNYLAYKESMKPFGFDMDYSYYCEYCNGRHYMDFLPQITTTDEHVLEEIHDRKQTSYKKYLDKAKVNTGLIDMIRNCKKDYKIALVTTASKKNTADIIGMFRYDSLFDLIITCEDIKYTKPNPECFLKAMEYYNAKPNECIIFEDSDVGIIAAKKTGATVFVTEQF